MVGGAVAFPAARPARDVPGVRSAAVAVLAHHVWFAGALAAVLVALALFRGRTGPWERAHWVTHALWSAQRREKPGQRDSSVICFL